MHIGMIGINHKQATLELRELLAQTCQQLFPFSVAIIGNATYIVLSTCNRTELYFHSSNLATTHSELVEMLRIDVKGDFDQKIYSYFGYDCLRHLARVAAGFDSAVLAETEIQGQVKSAYERAQAHLDLPKELHFLFQKALNIGKQARSQMSIDCSLPGVEHALLELAKTSDPHWQDAHILFIGASEVNLKLIRFFQKKNLNQITLCNRSDQKTWELAQQLQISPMEWQKLFKWTEYDWVIAATKAPYHLLRHTSQKETKGKNAKVLFDLGIPRNIDPLLGRSKKTVLYNIDQVHQALCTRRDKVTSSIIHGEEIVAAAARFHVERYSRSGIAIEKKKEG